MSSKNFLSDKCGCKKCKKKGKCEKKDKCEKKHKKCKCYVGPIVGTYTIELLKNGSPVSATVYANMAFHSDGTIHGQDNNDIGALANPVARPNGQLVTVWTGGWKQTSKNNYSFFITNVLNVINTTPEFPSTPLLRLSVIGTFVLTEPTFSGTLNLNSYALTDSTLSTPTLINTETITGTKVNLI